MQTSSTKLQQRAIQENPSYDEVVNLGISQEQAKKKASKLPDGEKETVSRLQSEVQRLKAKKHKKPAGAYVKKDKTDGTKKKSCERCGIWKCTGGDNCFAKGKSCNSCKKTGHFAISKLCPKKSETARKIQTDSGGSSSSDSDDTLYRIITLAKMKKRKAEKGELTRTSQAGEQKEENNDAKIKMAAMDDDSRECSIRPITDTGVRKTILCKSDWAKIAKYGQVLKTSTKFRPYGTNVQLPIQGKAKV